MDFAWLHCNIWPSHLSFFLSSFLSATCLWFSCRLCSVINIFPSSCAGFREVPWESLHNCLPPNKDVMCRRASLSFLSLVLLLLALLFFFFTSKPPSALYLSFLVSFPWISTAPNLILRQIYLQEEKRREEEAGGSFPPSGPGSGCRHRAVCNQLEKWSAVFSSPCLTHTSKHARAHTHTRIDSSPMK